MAEIAVISARKSKLRQAALQGDKKSELALSLAEKPSNFLSTVQVGITLIAILLGAIGEDRFVTRVAAILETIPIIEPVHNQLAFILVVAGITYASLIIGELVPKRIALNNAERIASFVSPIMLFISNMTSPIVHFLSFSTEFVTRILRIKKITEPVVTEDEIRILIREGTDIGIFNQTEKKLIERALALDDLRARMLMTPRHKIVWFTTKNFFQDPYKYIVKYPHTRIILAEGSIDKVIGVLHVKDLLQYYLEKKEINIQEMKKNISKPHFIPEDMRALKVLEIFRHSSIHIAFVVDEFGVIQGLITLNDILEALVGDIKTRTTYDPKIVKRPDGSLLMDGSISIKEFKKNLGIKSLPKEDIGSYQTVGGFIVSYLDRIPKTGDKFEWNHYIFEVMDMDDTRVDKILVTKTTSHN